jgi:type III pantothenate kinase
MAMSTWILEVGNSRAKWAKFSSEASPQDDPLSVNVCPLAETLPETAHAWVQDIDAEDHVVVTGSGHLEPWIVAFRPSRVFRPGDDVPLLTDATEPGKLGLDRVANAWAVATGSVPGADPSKGWMVVDAGTCMTVDLVVGGRHLGGSIAPGVRMRLQAMHQHTHALPWIEEAVSSMGNTPVLGTNTREAMVSGAFHSLDAELSGTWMRLKEEFPNLGMILTGGDAQHLQLRAVSPRFADANLTLKGHHALHKHLHDSH